MQKKISTIISLFLIMTSLAAPMKLFARIGVGIGTGKIEMTEPLKAGSIHIFPPISVVNTGDQRAEYELGVEYHEGVPELRPDREWFRFKPERFYLDPKESQLVEIVMELPMKVQPGDYFCYLEGRSLDRATTSSGTSIGVAAGAKTYFTIAPATWWQGAYYKAQSFWTHYAPWTNVGAVVIIVAIAVLILRRFISLKIGVGFKKGNKDEKTEESTARQNDQAFYSLLAQALMEVERYTNSLSEKQQKKLFREAKKHRKGIVAFLNDGNSEIFSKISQELETVLILSQKGLEQMRRQDPRAYSQAKEMVLERLGK